MDEERAFIERVLSVSVVSHACMISDDPSFLGFKAMTKTLPTSIDIQAFLREVRCNCCTIKVSEYKFAYNRGFGVEMLAQVEHNLENIEYYSTDDYECDCIEEDTLAIITDDIDLPLPTALPYTLIYVSQMPDYDEVASYEKTTRFLSKKTMNEVFDIIGFDPIEDELLPLFDWGKLMGNPRIVRKDYSSSFLKDLSRM